MLNFEKYANDIKLMSGLRFGLVEGEPVPCMGLECEGCDFSHSSRSCIELRYYWLFQEVQDV